MRLDLSTAGVSHASARHPWLVISAWIVALIAALAAISAFLDGALTTDMARFTTTPESVRGEELLEERLTGPRQITELVLIRSDAHTVDDPEFEQRVQAVVERLGSLGPEIIDFRETEGGEQPNVVSYLTAGLPEEERQGLISADRDTALLQVTMAGDLDEAQQNAGELVTGLTGEEAASELNSGGFRVYLTGQASSGHDFVEVSERDLIRGEAIGVGVALIVLIVVFGALAAAPAPIILGAVSIFMAVGLTALLGRVFTFSFFVTNMITMIGLAVGIDYALFIIARFREELRNGREKLDAIRHAGDTASRAVVFSGMTVVLALTGMLIVPSLVFQSLALGAIFVVLFAVLATLTLLPAVLSLMGRRVNSLRVPFVSGPGGGDNVEGGHFWERISNAVMRRPVIFLTVSTAAMLLFAVPFLDMNRGIADVSSLPDRFESKQGFEVLEEEFPGSAASPTRIVVDGDVDNPEVQAAIEDLRQQLRQDPTHGQANLRVNDAGNLALVTTNTPGSDASGAAQDSIERLREVIVPEAFGGAPAEVYVTGATAGFVDFFSVVDRFTPYVFAIVLGLSFVLLTIVFRSIVVPAKAILMNLLSVGAAYGLVVLFTQKGFLKEITGFQQVEAIEAWLPLFLFSILFGLSMDYHVFLLSRIRERYDQTHDNRGSVAFGLRTTGAIITGAALIMVAVFGGFASGELVMFQQMGFGLAVAVLLDATVIRSIVVPSGMRLLGHANWYLPPFLRWLPDLRVEGESGGHGGATAPAETPAGD